MSKSYLEFFYKYYHQLASLTNFDVVKVVLGNVSCDLDSSVCALVYAHYLSVNEPNHDGLKTAVFPMLNILEKELPIKTEVCYFLRQNNIPLKKLIFRDTLDLHDLHSRKKLRLILVDHHVLPKTDVPLASAVSEIIDHRPRDSTVSWEGVKSTIERVGSCASLVGRTILKSKYEVSPTVAQLLVGAIILDTANFSESYGQTTDVDRDVYKALVELHDGLIPASDLFKQLSDAKQDVSCLTAEQVLIKDLKVAGIIPIAGFPFLLQDLVSGKRVYHKLLQAVKDLGTANGSNMVVLLGLQTGCNETDEIKRDLGIFSVNSSLSEKLIEFLKTEAPSLQLVQVSNQNVELKNILVFQVLNTKASRKVVLPMIMAFQKKYGDLLSHK